ncbi:cyclic pyranopterin monophosphate synthase MoaC [Desulfovibrio litoralis]|uniref:Cyclic pyranopterin monophosphate synthase n=1 Tax=Desulfovibrio litoralis DSM 11393 TaxID=1121455 RepID=A0A1M7S881_9BACT|nr:cyclic pyranopterin monophosphate synthase MoaC [Desulfovibrio litoralis]SHN54691.1 cyclic pyranopterin monophosphate synthase subunit MoaC [Desulfovibrio litoralis DSM 11393]
MNKPKLSHLDENGSACMVDVGNKEVTRRVAIAETTVLISEQTLNLLKEKALPKGDALNTAKVAGILAAKRTAELIPLCHPLPFDFCDIRFKIQETPPSVLIEAEVRTSGRTGIEMEALTAVQVAALSIYDMCKAVQKDIKITNCRLLFKSGGKSGTYRAID